MNNNLKKITKRIKILSDISLDKRMNTVIERLKLSLFILILYIFLCLLHIGCPIRFVTGISCPGCGMTRAVLAVFRLDFSAAFHYHPLFVLAPVMFFNFLFEAYIHPRVYKAVWIVIIILFLIVYIIRLFIFRNDVVLIDINQGIVLKLLHQIHVGGH